MSLGIIFGKRTWFAVAMAVAALLLWATLGALLITKSLLPLAMANGWLYGGCGLAALIAGTIAGKGQGGRVAALVATLLLYGALWGAALSCGQPLDVRTRGLGITLAMAVGGLASYWASGKRRKKKYGRKRSTNRYPIRPVT